MRKISTIVHCFVLMISSVGFGFSATINVNCDYLSISNAVCHVAKEGDTVLIGPGDCTITNIIQINRNISFTIAGSGTNLTTLRNASSHGIFLYNNSSNVFTIRDINWVCKPGNIIGIVIGTSNFDFVGPYHIYNIRMTNVMGRGISFGAGKSHNSYGLIDHSTFIAATNGYFQQAIDFSGSGVNSWTNANPLGTTNVSCVEDCYFWTLPSGNGGNGFFDSYVGAQVVFRRNYCDGYAPIGGHGYDSQATSIRTWEIYDNIFTNHFGANFLMVWRGGSGVVFSNQCWGNPAAIAGLLYYRATPALFPGQSTRSGYLTYGVPGQGYIINFQGNQAHGGIDQCFTNQPANRELMVLGHTWYYFLTNLSDVGFQMVNANGFGGGAVKIGDTVAATITNFYNAVNVVPSAYGKSYTNWSSVPFNMGYELIAIGYDANNLYLTNALDCNTNRYGYPAFHQPGVIGSLPLSGTNFVQHAVKWPAYCWGNTLNGSPNNSMVLGAPNTYLTNLIALGRDFFTNQIPSSGTYRPLDYPHPLNVLARGGLNATRPVGPSNFRWFKGPND
jgi:hypothetical protein